jgi:hypothetical protein
MTGRAAIGAVASVVVIGTAGAAWRAWSPDPVPPAPIAIASEPVLAGAPSPVPTPVSPPVVIPRAELPRVRTVDPPAATPPPAREPERPAEPPAAPMPEVGTGAPVRRPIEFDKVSLLVEDGDKNREQKARLVFGATGLTVVDDKTGAVLRRLSYRAITAATYAQSKPVKFLRFASHWLTVESGGADLVLRLDKDNYLLVLPELQDRADITVARRAGTGKQS